MPRILFVCHGNICRSTMAQFVMADLARKAGRDDIEVDSAATSQEELGHDVHPGTRERLQRAGIVCGHHRSRQIGPKDYEDFDYIVGMDQENLDGMYRLVAGERGAGYSWPHTDAAFRRAADPEHKVSLLMSWTGTDKEVADPWYTGDFDATFDDVLTGCRAMLSQI